MSTISVKDMQGDIRIRILNTFLLSHTARKKNNNGMEIGIERLRIFQCH